MVQTAPVQDLSERIVVAMSGGVDSCAAAVLLARQGYEVIGVSMQVWDYRQNGGNAGRATCCAPSDFDDARQVAEKEDFPFYVFDFEQSFEKEVIAPFVDAYLNGYTPNPCLDCNRKVKFRELRARARALGASKVATGHYAQIRALPDGTLGLFSSIDDEKDQSYFLYAMTQQDLAETIFPVGGMKKPEVRKALESWGYRVASKEESQDICFVSTTAGDFVERRSTGARREGDIVGTGGELLGRHEGVHRYTVGQRRGLGLSNPSPLYVIGIDAEKNRIEVGERSALERSGYSVCQVNWISGFPPAPGTEILAKMRYRHSGVRCQIVASQGDRVELSFVDQWSAVSPGQAAVFYSPEPDSQACYQVLGGGIIEKDDVKGG